jgi:hypothetical protein
VRSFNQKLALNLAALGKVQVGQYNSTAVVQVRRASSLAVALKQQMLLSWLRGSLESVAGRQFPVVGFLPEKPGAVRFGWVQRPAWASASSPAHVCQCAPSSAPQVQPGSRWCLAGGRWRAAAAAFGGSRSVRREIKFQNLSSHFQLPVMGVSGQKSRAEATAQQGRGSPALARDSPTLLRLR